MWIHECKNWPDFFWDNASLAAGLTHIRYKQGCLMGRMSALGFGFRQEATLGILTADVVKSSAIEGQVLNPLEVRSSIARRLGLDVAGLPPVSRDVDGIVEMMLDATQQHDIPLTIDRLLGWHTALFPTGRSSMHKITVGAFRPENAGAMQVVSGPIGHEKVHFEAPKAERLSAEMKIFLTWFEGNNVIDPVLRAGLAHFWFVTLHPFEDGNGRIARAIADMALARAENSRERYYSMSAQIEKERKVYYEVLEHQQRNNMDITFWLDWFLGCLGRAIDNSENMLDSVLYKAKIWEYANLRSVNNRQRLVLNRMLEGFQGHMNNSKYVKLAKCSADTALRDIQELLTYGLLVQNLQGGRSTSYRLASLIELQKKDK